MNIWHFRNLGLSLGKAQKCDFHFILKTRLLICHLCSLIGWILKNLRNHICDELLHGRNVPYGNTNNYKAFFRETKTNFVQIRCLKNQVSNASSDKSLVSTFVYPKWWTVFSRIFFSLGQYKSVNYLIYSTWLGEDSLLYLFISTGNRPSELLLSDALCLLFPFHIIIFFSETSLTAKLNKLCRNGPLKK
jgi:hypothetical protein